jgi:rubredoxin
MNDWDATIGTYRARKCEWFFDIDTPNERKCGKPVIPGKSYCPDCYTKAYYIPTPKKKKERA